MLNPVKILSNDRNAEQYRAVLCDVNAVRFCAVCMLCNSTARLPTTYSTVQDDKIGERGNRGMLINAKNAKQLSAMLSKILTHAMKC